MNQRFGIKDTRFVEVLISYQMQQKKRNVLPSKSRPVKIYQNFQKKKLILQKKNPRNKIFLHLCAKFQSPRSNNNFFQNRFNPLNHVFIAIGFSTIVECRDFSIVIVVSFSTSARELHSLKPEHIISNFFV